MPSEPRKPELTDDAALGGRLRLLQMRKGHRFGHDAILLAAAVAARKGQHAVDLGAGIGAAGLALAARVPGLHVTLVEIDPALAALAAENIARNQMPDRVRAMVLDVTARPQAFATEGLGPASVDHVLMNPPFNDPGRQRGSPDPVRRKAHEAEPETLVAWIRTASRLLRPKGTLTLIWRADGLAAVLENLRRTYGGVTVLPIHPDRNTPAIRILVQAVKESRAPLALLPGFFLSDEPGRQSAAANAILRDGEALSLRAGGQAGVAKPAARKPPSEQSCS
jgi:tRNA1(Val) A37 N6-methylase TrmN6